MNDTTINFSSSVSENPTKTEIVQTERNNNSSIFSFGFSNQTTTGDVFTLAEAFLSIEEMTNEKLQKLCYYAKAWYLALYDYNLISEHFEAWVHGAVQPALYKKYKIYGYAPIPKVEDIHDIPEEFLEFAKEIFESYGHLTGNELERINHQEMPWLNARKGFKPWENCNEMISEKDMKEFYRNMM